MKIINFKNFFHFIKLYLIPIIFISSILSLITIEKIKDRISYSVIYAYSNIGLNKEYISSLASGEVVDLEAYQSRNNFIRQAGTEYLNLLSINLYRNKDTINFYENEFILKNCNSLKKISGQLPITLKVKQNIITIDIVSHSIEMANLCINDIDLNIKDFNELLYPILKKNYLFKVDQSEGNFKKVSLISLFLIYFTICILILIIFYNLKKRLK